MKLGNFKVLTFDVYGTLIDWETGIIEGLKPLTDRVSHALGRDKILEAHAFHESAIQRLTPSKPYRDLLPVVYRRLAEEWKVTVSWDECTAYGATVGRWPAFPDSAETLEYLKRHYRLAVLTNTDNVSFAGSNATLRVEFDGVYTAEDIGSYKPAPRNFAYMIEALGRQGFDRSQILHVAESLFHDHVPANEFRLANCWIYRRHDKDGFGATMDPGTTPHADFRFNSMAEFAAAHRAEADT